jgi:hypothetical protein
LVVRELTVFPDTNLDLVINIKRDQRSRDRSRFRVGSISPIRERQPLLVDVFSEELAREQLRLINADIQQPGLMMLHKWRHRKFRRRFNARLGLLLRSQLYNYSNGIESVSQPFQPSVRCSAPNSK